MHQTREAYPQQQHAFEKHCGAFTEANRLVFADVVQEFGIAKICHNMLVKVPAVRIHQGSQLHNRAEAMKGSADETTFLRDAVRKIPTRSSPMAAVTSSTIPTKNHHED